MAIISLPAGARFRNADWRLTIPQQVNRSAWTGKRQLVGLPGGARWRVTAEVVPIIRERNIEPWRAFFAKLNGSENMFRMPATEGPQIVPVTVAKVAPVNSGLTPTSGMTLNTNKTVASKASGVAAWDSSVHSPTPIAAPCMLSFRPNVTSGSMVIGLRSGTKPGNNFNTIDRAFQLNGASQFRIIEMGVPITSYAAITQGDILSIAVQAGFATYAINGQVIAGRPAPTSALSLDSSFFDVGASAADIGFGSVAAGATTLRLSGLPASAVYLRAGQFMTVPVGQSDEQLVALKSDLLANAEGWAVAEFAAPLRLPYLWAGYTETAAPSALVALDEPVTGWAVGAGQQYSVGITASEAF